MPSPSTFTSAHRQYVQSLYKRRLKNSLDWTVSRDVWRAKAMQIRAEFEYNRNVKDPRELAIILQQAEEKLASWQHPDPYISPTAPGGTKWERNLPPPTENPYAHDEPVQYESTAERRARPWSLARWMGFRPVAETVLKTY